MSILLSNNQNNHTKEDLIYCVSEQLFLSALRTRSYPLYTSKTSQQKYKNDKKQTYSINKRKDQKLSLTYKGIALKRALYGSSKDDLRCGVT